MAKDPDLKPGWYTTDKDGRRYWTGTEWVTPDDSPPPDNATAPPVKPVDAPKPRSPKSRKKLIIGGAVVVALAATGWALFLRGSAADRQAIAVCEEALLDTLKSPSTAVFYDSTVMTWGDHMTWYLDDGPGSDSGYSTADHNRLIRDAQSSDRELAKSDEYSAFVVGEVDAQNSYGAIERSTWSCLAAGGEGTPTVGVIITFGDEFDYFDLG